MATKKRRIATKPKNKKISGKKPVRKASAAKTARSTKKIAKTRERARAPKETLEPPEVSVGVYEVVETELYEPEEGFGT